MLKNTKMTAFTSPLTSKSPPQAIFPTTIIHLGQLCEFVRCDRANLFRITQYSIERAINRGWRWEDVIDF